MSTIASIRTVHTYQMHGRDLEVTATARTSGDPLSYDVLDADTGFHLHHESLHTMPTREQVEDLISRLITMHNEADFGDEASFFDPASVAEFLSSLSDHLTISLSVENSYELYESETVRHVNKVIPAPPNYTVEWLIITTIDGTAVKNGTDYVFATSSNAAGRAATELASDHPEFDPRISPRITIVQVREIDAGNENLDEWQEWAMQNLIDPFTGVGHEDGDSWYDVSVTACSDPTLIGKEFSWGY